ncbi:Acetylglutamate kinase [Actinidia chinensis var. chinensis]|uniref:acetylglutamate kinase n=1 Tax=Actinidia chinensis var. chinensis TaxID=1590841 RepID=A0A2R6PJ42_ACTCC|nr:Acetylglutamate kinase [Actinidia chinensis var. chinensis]
MAGAKVVSSSLSSRYLSPAAAERSVGRHHHLHLHHHLHNFPPTLSTTTKSPIIINIFKKKNFLTPCLKSTGKISDDSSPPLDDSKIPPHMRVNIYSESLPFIQKFRGKTIVVKYGGAAMKSESLQSSVITDLVLLSCVGLRIVLVHGGGPEINHWLTRLGIQPNFLNGLRVTDASTMEVVSMVLVGKLNKHLVSLINKAGATAVGLSGIDARLLTARPSPNSVQLGFVGDIAVVDPSVLRPLIENNHIPVIASVAADEEGQSYNINADTAAGELAAALGAEKLILLTDVAGILEDKDDPGSLVKEIDIKGVKRMMEGGKIGGGMIPKVNCCVRSIAQGVRTASIIDGRVPHSLLLEILTDQGAGTMIIG